MSYDLYADPDFVRETYSEPPQASTPVAQSSSVVVTDVNGISGPSVVFSGGTSGFSYSTAAPNITLNSPLTTKGDLYVRNATQGTRLAVGADGTFLVADSGQATGLKWLAGITGWTAATGTATRSGFDTTTVTLPQLAEALKALLDDLLTLKVIKP